MLPGNSYGQLFFNKQNSIEGNIIDNSTKQKISFAHILNESKRNGAICNDDGGFRMAVDIGDTLIFSALGYLGKVLVVNDSMFQTALTINLIPRVYEIGQVNIMGFRSYEDFKQKFIALELPKTQTDMLRDQLYSLSLEAAKQAEYEKSVEKALSNDGATLASVPILSKEDKQRLHLKEILKQEDRQRVIDKKFNREIVAKLTELKDDELTEFLVFCNFSEQYLFEANQYDILETVLKKLELFKNMKKGGSFILDHENSILQLA